ncbi:MAG TPA: hypothetical protein VKU01_16225 [Bryobacteraceae bacterium]|nr:hypothetical protein [Bryobacteraceae bacterium]
MDLRAYFQKIRSTEKSIAAEHVIVVSLETQDGGREGQSSEVTRANAAKLIVDGKARLATPAESAAYRGAKG